MGLKFAIFLALFVGYEANYYYDLENLFNVDPSRPPKDAKVVDGPNGDGKAIIYSDKKPVYVTGGETPYLITALTTSTDFTYFTWFKMPSTKMEKNQDWMFFSIQGKGDATPVLFGVGLSYISGQGQGSEDTGAGDRVYSQYLTLKQYTIFDLNTKSKHFKLKEEFKPDTWYRIMMRMRSNDNQKRRRRAASSATVDVYVDCKLLATGKLDDGMFDNYLPTGYAVFGGSMENANGVLTPKDSFPGAVAKSQIINGKYAYEFYSPCSADFSVQDIPSEPLPSEYSDKKWKLFEKVTSSVKSVSITCPGYLPTRYNGEVWVEDRCKQFECKNGKVTEKWICPGQLCTDQVTGNKYKKQESWIDENDRCLKHTCLLEFEDTKSEKITCQPITKDDCADGFDPIKLPNECCLKCASDTCPEGRQYSKGCQRTCADGPFFVCPNEKVGCWCAPGYVEDKDGKCIPLNTCPCISGKIVYQPGQTAKRSSCETCVCVNGAMQCFERC